MKKYYSKLDKQDSKLDNIKKNDQKDDVSESKFKLFSRKYGFTIGPGSYHCGLS